MKHLVLVLATLALILSVPLAAFAQEGSNPLCNGLSDDDCAKMMAAIATIETVQSFTVPAWSISFSMNDGTEETALSASGSAGFVLGDTVDDIVVHIVVDSLSVTPTEEDLPESLEVIMAGGFGYVNVNGDWFGEELSEEDIADLEETMGMMNMGEMGGMEESLSTLGIDLTGVLTTTRGDDVDMMGQPVATYDMNVDLAGLLMALLSSPMVGEMMGMGGEEAAMSPEEMQMMGALFLPILGNTTISAGLGVGNDDGYIHHVELNVVLDINLAMFDPETGAIAGALNFSADVSGVDEGYSVDVPSEYGTMEELEEMYGGVLEGINLEEATGGIF